jgi:hypothetical protein
MLQLREAGTHHEMHTTTTHIKDSRRQFDVTTQKALSDVCGAPLTPKAWAQAQLPLTMGGLGLRATTLHAAGAYLASVQVSMTEVDDVEGMSEATALWQDAASVTGPQVDWTQNHLSRAVDMRCRHLLLADAGAAMKARLLSVSSPHAPAWLEALPNPANNTHLTAPEFSMQIRWWLG